MLEAHGQPMVYFEDIKDEVFDMVKPADPLKITLEDLLKRLVLFLWNYRYLHMSLCVDMYLWAHTRVCW